MMDYYRRDTYANRLKTHPNNHPNMPGCYPTDNRATVEDEHEIDYLSHPAPVYRNPYASRPTNHSTPPTYFPQQPAPLSPTFPTPTHPHRPTPEFRYLLKLHTYNPLSDELLAPILLDVPHRQLAEEALQMRRVLNDMLDADKAVEGRVRSGDKLDGLLRVVGHLMDRVTGMDEVLFRMGQVLVGAEGGCGDMVDMQAKDGGGEEKEKKGRSGWLW